MFDLKINNVKILDYETDSENICDIGIKDGKIASIGNCNESARREIDASGNIASPGFIDIHMHEELIGCTVDGDDFDISNKMLLMGVTTCVGGNCGENVQSLDDFFSFIDNNGSPVNYLSFVGHNDLRNIVGINDEYRCATKQEITRMKALALSAIEKGAIGMSTAIEMSPGIEFNEIVEICNYIRNENILLSAHFRKDTKHAIDSITELVNISRETGLPMQISHLNGCSAYGMMKESLKVIREAIDKGIDVTADCYPYNAFCNVIGSPVFDDGCFESWNKTYDSVLLLEEPYEGIRCNKEIFYRVRKEYPDLMVVASVMNEEEAIEALKAPFVMVASDGVYRKGQGHPRGAGTFPRVLGKYVRELNEMSLIDALKKMTIIPAKRLGLISKGEIKEGYDADIVIFNPNEIIDIADYKNPTAKPKGISFVIVDGKIAVENNNIKNNRLGKIIRRNQLNMRKD